MYIILEWEGTLVTPGVLPAKSPDAYQLFGGKERVERLAVILEKYKKKEIRICVCSNRSTQEIDNLLKSVRLKKYIHQIFHYTILGSDQSTDLPDLLKSEISEPHMSVCYLTNTEIQTHDYKMLLVYNNYLILHVTTDLLTNEQEKDPLNGQLISLESRLQQLTQIERALSTIPMNDNTDHIFGRYKRIYLDLRLRYGTVLPEPVLKFFCHSVKYFYETLDENERDLLIRYTRGYDDDNRGYGKIQESVRKKLGGDYTLVVKIFEKAPVLPEDIYVYRCTARSSRLGHFHNNALTSTGILWGECIEPKDNKEYDFLAIRPAEGEHVRALMLSNTEGGGEVVIQPDVEFNLQEEETDISQKNFTGNLAILHPNNNPTWIQKMTYFTTIYTDPYIYKIQPLKQKAGTTPSASGRRSKKRSQTSNRGNTKRLERKIALVKKFLHKSRFYPSQFVHRDAWDIWSNPVKYEEVFDLIINQISII